MVAFDANGPVYGELVSPAPSAARTTNGSSGALVVNGRNTLRLTLSVTASSGTTPNLAVTVETSGDGTTWYSAGTFAAKTANGTERKAFSGLDRFARVSWVITGTTPSFTFSVAGELV